MPSLSQPTQLQRHPQPRPFANLEDFLLALQLRIWEWQPIRETSAELAGSWEAGKTVLAGAQKFTL